MRLHKTEAAFPAFQDNVMRSTGITGASHFCLLGKSEYLSSKKHPIGSQIQVSPKRNSHSCFKLPFASLDSVLQKGFAEAWPGGGCCSVTWDVCHHCSVGSEGWPEPLRVKQLAAGLLEVGFHPLLALKESEVCHVVDAGCCAPFRWSTPGRDKGTMRFPEAAFANCYGSHIRIEWGAILGSLSHAGCSWWNQPFSAQHCLTTMKTTWILSPGFFLLRCQQWSALL